MRRIAEIRRRWPIVLNLEFVQIMVVYSVRRVLIGEGLYW